MYTQDVGEEGKIDTQNFLFIIGVMLIILMGVVLLLVWKQLPPELPWLYSLPWGEQQLIGKAFFAGTLLGLTVIFVITKVLAVWAGKTDVIVKTTVIAGGLMMILLYAAGFFKVLNIFVSL